MRLTNPIVYLAVLGSLSLGWARERADITGTAEPDSPAVAQGRPGEGISAQAGNLSAASSGAPTVVPRLIRFSGNLQNLASKPIAGPVDVTFSLYADEAGGAALWFETQTVQADSLGHYTVLLGAMNPAGVPVELFTVGEARWLGVMVQGLPEQPRVLLVSVPYAMKAGDAETLAGRPASEYQLTPEASSSDSNARSGKTTSRDGAASSLTKPKSPTPQVVTTTQNYIPVFADNTGAVVNSVIYQLGSRIGVGTTSPSFGFDLNSNILAIGPKQAQPGAGGTMRFRDDTGTVRWSFGVPGVVGATDFFIYNNVNGSAPLYIQAGAASYSLYLNGNGNVGIGTAKPSAKLEVNGTAKFDQAVTFAASQNFSTTNGTVSALGGTFTGNGPGPILSSIQSGAGPAAVLNSVGGGKIISGQKSGVETFKVTADGSITLGGNLNLPQNAGNSAGVMTLGGIPFIHTCCAPNNQVFVGPYAGNFTNAGSSNVGIGPSALGLLSTGSQNTALGYGALFANTTGGSNTAVGAGALGFNSTGVNNTAVGSSAMRSVTSFGNTGVGAYSLYDSTGAASNTALGGYALFHNTTGSYNTAVGAGAGYAGSGSNTNTTGSYNTYLGYNAGQSTSSQFTNSTAIGAYAAVGKSNALVLGGVNGVNGASSNVNVGIGTTTPAAAFHVASGDMYDSQAGSGLIVRSPDGTKCARIGIDNSGALSVSAVTCP